ncbi:hypothetical protein KXD93_05210 [Mucilaginibacter sp. BJC16-A38]|uniref:hypothetical protein n=1 Tax=Mucilaginibacter phenanthrenivorans TaxID=1234842 RepID=UPI002157C832|nr:hypothetical protein [Mucilaginibacter phenanthrenivorans]MCR8557026.1 hypothetical protein [Mucilaginibacter phenanthrenivorans]
MEVHHHPKVPHEKNKHLKEYFLEFLMIFLAVTMGFIAESIREHSTDSSKEKEYIEGMIKDLKVDTANIKFIISQGNEQLRGLDTLKNISREKLSDLKVQDSLYKYSTHYLFGLNPFKSEDITLIQLRNAGGYRLIRKGGAVDSIARYESKLDIVSLQQTFLSQGITKAVDAANLIFNFNAYAKMRLHPGATEVLVTTDKEKINSFYNQCWMMSVMVTNYNSILKNHLEYSTTLIAYLKKTYNME